MTIETIINEKIKDVKLNESEGTVRFYKSHSSHLLKWCNNNDVIFITDLTDEKLIDYITFMKKTASNTTINKRIGMLKRIYDFSNIDFKFLLNLKKFKETKKTFNILTTSQLKSIINYAKGLTSEDKIMYKVLILLLTDTGARINEIMNIEKKNISLKSNEILLTTTKTKEDRTVFFLSDTKEVISEALEQNNNSKFLLYNIRKNRQMNYDDVRYFMRLLKSELELDKLHSHMFRHTFATTFIEKDADLFSVMEILGHKNIETTERYAHVSKRHVKKTYQEKFER